MIRVQNLVLLSLVALVACGASGTYGRMQQANDATSLFLEGEVLPGHTYYYAGTPGAPHTLMALRSDLTLASPKWRTFDPGDGTLQSWSVAIRNQFAKLPSGYWIYAGDGERIGARFSSALQSSVRVGDRGEVYIRVTDRPRLKHEDY